MPVKVYLSGPVTGRDRHTTEHLFGIAEKAVRNMGLEPVNPIKLCAENMPWNEAMKVCVGALLDCQLIVLLPGWEESDGAQLELTIAKSLQINQLKIQL